MMAIEPVPLHQATRERYLSYALSVITSRALPDVRDGLKPVQRRILYTMFNELSLHPTGRYRKCAAVVGEVMGKFHPHGDQSIYDALVRMSQDFSLRHPLVDGQGNFGSLDGDPAAAMRYTECRLRSIAEDLLNEIGKGTVDFRPNYDGQRFEPIVLPAQFPQVLVNGSEGIAVGMATRIPPHNLGEVVDAAIALSENRRLGTHDLMQFVLGPDFPTGGQILSSHDEIFEIYDTGQGTIRLRSTWRVEQDGRRKQVIIDTIPYGQNKARLIEKIGELVVGRKLPLVVDVRDESTDDVRIVLDLKQGASPEAAMAFLFKHTPLEGTWPINLTCLIPGEGDVATPARLGLVEILGHWLDFRYETVRRRFEFDLAELKKRIHILEGLEALFDALDEAIAIIRTSEGKRDAAEKLMARFDLTEEQTDAILMLRLYKIARLEIRLIREELEEKRAQAAEYEAILSDPAELWRRVRTELKEIRDLYADARRTLVEQPARELHYNEDAYIVKEDTFVVVTRDGWMKRQSSFSDISKIRLRDGDEIGWLIKAHTRATVTLFSSHGVAYVMRVDDVPATTGHGEPAQAHFAFSDGERIVGVVTNDARHRADEEENQQALPLGTDADPPPPWGIAVTDKGKTLRFALAAHEEVSNRNGRKFARLGKLDAVFGVYQCDGGETVNVATRQGHCLVFQIEEVPVLRAAGKGVIGIKIKAPDKVVAFEVCSHPGTGPRVLTSRGREEVIRQRKFEAKRGGKGRVIIQRGSIDEWKREPILQLGVPDTEIDLDFDEETP